MKNHALVAKVRARRANFESGPGFTGEQQPKVATSPESLLRFLYKKNEQNFVKTFLAGLESDVQDLHYYLNLWRGAKLLQKPHSAAMQRIFGTEIDLQNIIWAYRLKKYYGIFGDTTYGFLVPVRHRLPANIFSHMVSCQNADGMQAILSGTIYRDTFGDFSNAQKCLVNAVKARYLTEGRRSHIALLCGYLYEVYQ